MEDSYTMTWGTVAMPLTMSNRFTGGIRCVAQTRMVVFCAHVALFSASRRVVQI